MAAVTSLGLHTPSALPYLVAEGILTEEAGEESYSWQSINSSGPNGEYIEDELLSTDNCVVWSRCGTVQRIFRFDIEKEQVTQAIFARFPSQAAPASQPDTVSSLDGTTRNFQKPTRERELPQGKDVDTGSQCPPSKPPTAVPSLALQSDKSRALVVVLRTQAHVFFLSGTSHI
ncbi:MAG: hypothetical protein Q9198_010699, partial [Flavoplaca austrocitrina]